MTKIEYITDAWKMIEIGQKMETGFRLKIVKNGKEKEVEFSELLTRPTIVSVYMRNNTSGCDRQNQSLSEHAEKLERKGYQLVALSKDGCRSHKNYAEKLNIDYILASDPGFAFAEATDSIVEKKMFGKTFNAPSRSAYVIDTDGTLLGVIKKVNTKAHAEELMELIDNL